MEFVVQGRKSLSTRSAFFSPRLCGTCVRSVLYPAMVNVLCSKYVRVCAHRGADMLRATAEVVPTTYVKSLKMTGFFVKRQVAKP